MSFYNEHTTAEQREHYDKMLVAMASLSNLFSSNDKPYLNYRVTENIFCRYLNAENLSRSDVTVDAKKDNIGIGVKTWVGSNKQKIAEFDKQKSLYEGKTDREAIRIISSLRNERIDFTRRLHNLETTIYHCIIRDTGTIKIAECSLEPIVIDDICNVQRNQNILTFDDGINGYSFNISKSTLYKDFSNMDSVRELSVDIISDPFSLLETCLGAEGQSSRFTSETPKNVVYLPLYSDRGGRHVQERSGLNQRLAQGRVRDPYEVYIPIRQEFNERYGDFFPPRYTPFRLYLPNRIEPLEVAVCQENSKALMSNPNSALGHWLLDEVFKVEPFEPITYAMLEKYGIDSVRIEKIAEGEYKIDFARMGSYERFMGITRDDVDLNEDDEDSND